MRRRDFHLSHRIAVRYPFVTRKEQARASAAAAIEKVNEEAKSAQDSAAKN
jgi:hypothetical protein